MNLPRCVAGGGERWCGDVGGQRAVRTDRSVGGRKRNKPGARSAAGLWKGRSWKSFFEMRVRWPTAPGMGSQKKKGFIQMCSGRLPLAARLGAGVGAERGDRLWSPQVGWPQGPPCDRMGSVIVLLLMSSPWHVCPSVLGSHQKAALGTVGLEERWESPGQSGG